MCSREVLFVNCPGLTFRIWAQILSESILEHLNFLEEHALRPPRLATQVTITTTLTLFVYLERESSHETTLAQCPTPLYMPTLKFLDQCWMVSCPGMR